MLPRRFNLTSPRVLRSLPSFPRDLPPGPGAGADHEREAPHQCNSLPERGRGQTPRCGERRLEETPTRGHGEESEQPEGEDELRQSGKRQRFPPEEPLCSFHGGRRGPG